MQFNEQQRLAIESLRGAYLISAPVGTGKTTVLAERIVKALADGFSPESILALTFTNKASEEMLDRIKAKVQNTDTVAKLTIKTFHGFCAYLIRAEAKEIGLEREFDILDESEQLDLAERLVELFPTLAERSRSGKNQVREILEESYRWRLGELEQQIGLNLPRPVYAEDIKKFSQAYISALNEQSAVDFNQLVLLVIELLYNNKKVQQKWAKRYQFIQVDEFQDTHLSEYLVVKELAKEHRNLTFIGDLDQTIYSWRGSEPFLIKEIFARHFAPVKEINLEINYRFNENILAVVKSFLNSFEKKATQKIESYRSDSSKDEKCVDVFGAYNLGEEAAWIVDNISHLREREPEARIAVLTRTNPTISFLADIFAEHGVAHITVDKYDFFRRQEVRDIYAYLKLLFNRFDLEAARRVLARPNRGLGEETWRKVQQEGEKIALRLSDFLHFPNYQYAEPYTNLLAKWKGGRLVVLDTETTGTNPARDEVIQIYATEVISGQAGREFHFYLKNTLPVGESEEVHGLSDEFLRDNGREPAEVMAQLRDFIGGDAVVGHNVGFDLAMLRENSRRLKQEIVFGEHYDTLDLARRTVVSESYRLSHLSEMFGLAQATHDARDDVLATVGLLGVMVEKLTPATQARAELWARFSPKFIKLASSLDAWRKKIDAWRPVDFLAYIWKESGLEEYYQKDKEAEKRQKSWQILQELFRSKDEVDQAPSTVLRELIQHASLARDLNFLGLEQGKVPIVTVHQVKGLEFDYVFIAGVNERFFPLGRDLEEEKRLFYVALTRARRHIFLSYSRFDVYGRALAKSRFIDFLDKKYLDII